MWYLHIFFKSGFTYFIDQICGTITQVRKDKYEFSLGCKSMSKIKTSQVTWPILHSKEIIEHSIGQLSWSVCNLLPTLPWAEILWRTGSNPCGHSVRKLINNFDGRMIHLRMTMRMINMLSVSKCRNQFHFPDLHICMPPHELLPLLRMPSTYPTCLENPSSSLRTWYICNLLCKVCTSHCPTPHPHRMIYVMC